MVLPFTPAEQSRSINWRELLGILRVFEFFGARMRGMLVLVETDNMAAKGAAAELSSKSEDMQELVRRLLERAAEVHTHTRAEARQTRPDLTWRSRGGASSALAEASVRHTGGSLRAFQ